jgi:superfamily I DNA and/or RNA helicase
LIKQLFQKYNIDITVYTVDSSEGKEAAIVVVGFTTPACMHTVVGFFSDKPRINVAFSRAIDGGIVIGSELLTIVPFVLIFEMKASWS